MDKSDKMFYVAWITLFILLGVWIVIWALDMVDFGEMFLLWLLCAGILLIALGTIRTRQAPKGSNLLIASGMLLSILMLMSLAVMSDLLGGWVGAGIGMILIGIVGLFVLIRNM